MLVGLRACGSFAGVRTYGLLGCGEYVDRVKVDVEQAAMPGM